MNRAAHLGRLVSELTSDGRYATGQRRFLRTVTSDDAADIAEGTYEEVDRAGEQRAEMAARQGMTIACRRGCNVCCNELVLAHGPELAAVARWLSRPENAEVRANFMAAYPEWRAKAGDGPERLSRLWAEDFAAYPAAHREQRFRRAMCAFNHDGACSIYPVRPVLCRDAHALETADYCGPDNTTGIPPQSIECPPYDEFLRRAQALIRAAHHAAGRFGEPPVSLCEAVHSMIATDADH